MKAHSLSILCCIRPWIIVLSCLLTSLPAMAQQEAQAGDEPIVLTRQNKTRVIKPGRRIKLYGPPGTRPIKGKLVSMGDSITIRPDNNRNYTQIRKVAAADVQAIGRRRLGWEIMGFYLISRFALTIAIGAFIGLSTPILAGGPIGLLVLYLVLNFGIQIGICFWLAYPQYRLSKWSLFRRGSS